MNQAGVGQSKKQDASNTKRTDLRFKFLSVHYKQDKNCSLNLKKIISHLKKILQKMFNEVVKKTQVINEK